MQVQLRQIVFSDKDEKYMVMPELSQDLQDKEKSLKRQHGHLIFLSCVASFFSLRMTYQMGLNILISSVKFTTLYEPIAAGLLLFMSLIGGVMMDVFSIKWSWLCFLCLSMFSQAILIISCIYDIKQLVLASFFLSSSAMPVGTILFTCLLFDSTFETRSTILNMPVQFEILADISPVILVLITEYIVLITEPAAAQQHDLLLLLTMISTPLSCLLNFLSLYTVKSTYSEIEYYRKQSPKYNKFLIYQGNCFSVANILKHFKNIDFTYILIAASVCGFQIRFTYPASQITFVNQAHQHIEFIIALSLEIPIAYSVIYYINSSKSTVTKSYEMLQLMLIFSAGISIFELAIQIIDPSSLSNNNSSVLLIVMQVSWILARGATGLIIYSLIHQMIIFLLPIRSTIRGISLSLTFIVFNTFSLLSYSLNDKSIIYSAVQTIHAFLALAFHFFYRKRRLFSDLDGIIQQNYKRLKVKSN